MMVIMRVNLSGTHDGQDWPAKGERVDVPEAEARDLVAAGLAVEAAVDDDEVETATVDTTPKRIRARRNAS